jgi:replicative DNA helicase
MSSRVVDVQMPADIFAERTILGAIMLDNSRLYEAQEALSADDFSLDSHKRIFLRMIDLADTGSSIDCMTLRSILAKTKELDTVGGFPYVLDLDAGLPTRPVIRDHMRIVKDKALLRKVMAISSVALARAENQSNLGIEVIGETIDSLNDAMASQKSSAKQIQEILPDAVRRFEEIANQPQTGLLGAALFTPLIDQATCGIQDTELCLIAARPGQGKTEAGLQTALRNARNGLRVHIQSLEMKRDPLLWRMWRLMARVPIQVMRDPRCLGPTYRRAIQLAQEEIADLPIQIDDTHELTVSDFRSRAILAARRWKADLLVVDYGQLLVVPRAKSAVEAAPKQAEALRHIARDYCKTAALVQLRRCPPNDLNKYPDIEDIFGASQWEQAAQIILMMHRTRHDKEFTGEDFCFLGKMREGQWLRPFGIRATPWGEFQDRTEGQNYGPSWKM